MTTHHADAAVSSLRGLPVLEPEPARAERIRARCRARIAARQPTGSADRQTGTARLEAALLSGFSAAYLLAILYLALGFAAVR